MIDARVLLGLPLDFEDVCQVYPPTVKDIVSNNNALAGYKLLTQTQEDIEDSIKKKKQDGRIPTPFEFVLINAYMDADFLNFIQAALKLYTHKEGMILFEQKMILLGTKEELLAINDLENLRPLCEDNFFDFQNILRQSMGESMVEVPPTNLNPVALRVYKAGKRRERAAKKKSGGISLAQSLCAICCMEIGINPLNIREMSYAAVLELSKMWQRKEKYNLDVNSLLAGADSKKIKPKYWIKEDSDYQEVNI